MYRAQSLSTVQSTGDSQLDVEDVTQHAVGKRHPTRVQFSDSRVPDGTTKNLSTGQRNLIKNQHRTSPLSRRRRSLTFHVTRSAHSQ
eukprot:6509659-Pyramimonas_sp.AAC.1